jgi:hypothetical protein
LNIDEVLAVVNVTFREQNEAGWRRGAKERDYWRIVGENQEMIAGIARKISVYMAVGDIPGLRDLRME